MQSASPLSAAEHVVNAAGGSATVVMTAIMPMEVIMRRLQVRPCHNSASCITKPLTQGTRQEEVDVGP